MDRGNEGTAGKDKLRPPTGQERTVCVRNLPFSYNGEKLEELFGDVGPIKRAFIVQNRETKRSKGYGYVTFAISEDAHSAVEKLNNSKIDGRSIYVEIPGKRTSKKVVTNNNDSTTNSSKTDTSRKDVRLQIKQSARTVVLWAIGEKTARSDRDEFALKTDFQQRLEKCGQVETFEVIQSAKGAARQFEIASSSKTALVCIVKAVMKTPNGAKQVITKNDRQKTGGLFIAARRLCSIAMSRKAKQSCELIVRNLSFKIRRDDIITAFQKFGPLAQVRLPSTEEKKSGFAFVRFHFRSDAAKALRKVNAKPLESITKKGKKKKTTEDERVVAVDWALSKRSFEAVQAKTTEKADSGNSTDDSDDSSSDDDDDDSASSSFDDSEDDDDDDDEDDKTAHGSAKETAAALVKEDLNAGTTLFLCNISLNATAGDLFRSFGKFGHIESLKMVRDKASDAFRGSAFLRYKRKESADAALERSSGAVAGGKTEVESTSGMPNRNVLTIHDRPVIVRRAVDRNEAKTRSEEKKGSSKKEDRRNMHLLQEGYIKHDSEAAKGLKESEIRKRQRGDKDKHDRLRSPLFFVSPKRLAVRNLSTSGALTLDRDLRQAALEAAKTGIERGVVDIEQVATHLRPRHSDIAKQKEANAALMSPDAITLVGVSILRDKERRDVKGRPRSRGCAFLEFSEHAHALATLRVLNNNPKYSSLSHDGNQRLIVGFAVENRAKLRKQREAAERRRVMNEQNKERRRISKLRAQVRTEEEEEDDDESDVARGDAAAAASSSSSSREKANRKKGGQQNRRDRSKRKKFATGVASNAKVISSVATKVISEVSKSIERGSKSNDRKRTSKRKHASKSTGIDSGDVVAPSQSSSGLKSSSAAKEPATGALEAGEKRKRRKKKRTKVKVDKADIAFDGLVSDYKKKLFSNVNERWFL